MNDAVNDAEVTAETLTNEQIDAEMKACRDDAAQAQSMIDECHNALWLMPRRRTKAGMARIAAAINARKAGGK